MDIGTAVDMSREALYLTLIISAPVMIVSVVIGLIISIMQAVTQIQDQTISFVPKILIMLLTMLYALPWAINRMVDYSSELIRDIPSRF